MSKLLRRQSFQAILSPGRVLSRSTSVRHYEKPTSASSAKSSTPKPEKKARIGKEENKENKENKKVPKNDDHLLIIAGR